VTYPEPKEAVAALFGEAVEQPPEDRRRFVEGSGAAESVQREVLALLAAHERADGRSDQLDPVRAAALLSATFEPEPKRGRRIGPYRILRQLGRGGMAVVYLAERADGAYEQQVALKLLSPALSSEALIERFLLERRIHARLEHPGIARLLDAGVGDDGEPYFVLEYVDGEPLTSWCDKNVFTITQRLRLFERICDAVQYAHGHLVVHRDLKPSNILITESGEVKLLDFGIAKLLAEEEGVESTVLTRLGLRPYTPGYAAPEQLRGDGVTVVTDVYALGVLLYELLTGRRPFADSSEETARNPARPSTVVERPLDPTLVGATGPLEPATMAKLRGTTPERLRRRLSGDLDTIVLKALREEPEQRYGSVQALAADVARHLDGQPITARPATMPYLAGRFLRRHRVGAAAAFLVVLAVLGGLIATAWQARQTRLAAERATRIKDQLIDLFSSPEEPRKAVATTREFLDHGVARLQDLPPGDPLREDLAGVLVGLYNQLGLPAQAERLADAELGGPPVNVDRAARSDLRLLTEWATAKWSYSRDLDTVWRTLVLATDHADDQSMVLADALIARARVGIASGRFGDAEAALRHVIAFLRGRVPSTDRRVVTARLELAAALVARRHNEQGRAETERLLVDGPQGDTRLRQKVLVMAALRRALFGEFAAAETLFAENEAIRKRRDSAEIVSFDEVSRAVNAFDLGKLALSEAALAEVNERVATDQTVAEIHWVRAELALYRGESNRAAAELEKAESLETRTRLRVYYAALRAVALERAGHGAEARSAIVTARRMATTLDAPDVARALLEAADAAVSQPVAGKTKDGGPGGARCATGFAHALAVLAAAREHPAVLEDQLKEKRDAVRIRLWEARTELEAGAHDRAQKTLAEALALGRSTLGPQHPYVRELERLSSTSAAGVELFPDREQGSSGASHSGTATPR